MMWDVVIGQWSVVTNCWVYNRFFPVISARNFIDPAGQGAADERVRARSAEIIMQKNAAAATVS